MNGDAASSLSCDPRRYGTQGVMRCPRCCVTQCERERRGEQDWAVYVGVNLVTQYATKDEAAEAMAWYLDTYGEPSEPLTIGPVPA